MRIAPRTQKGLGMWGVGGQEGESEEAADRGAES